MRGTNGTKKRKDEKGGMIQGVIALCSRGLVHSRTINSLWRAIPPGWRPYWELLTTDDKPIPLAQNIITEQALALDPQYIWYVEEDMGLPPGILVDMFNVGKPVVTVDYNIGRYDQDKREWVTVLKAIRREHTGKIRVCGMGCLLVQARVFAHLQKPYFDTLAINREGGVYGNHLEYGGQDGYFSRNLTIHGFEISEIPGEVKHYRLADPGSITSNKGVHRIIEL